VTEDILLALVDAYSSGLSYAASAKACGISKSTMWSYVKQSREGSESTIINWMGSPIQFERALVQGRKLIYLELRSRFEADLLRGYIEVPIYFQGMPTWQPDPQTVGWSSADRIAFGFEADGLLRDSEGRTIQNVERRPMPVAATLAGLSMAFDEFVAKTKTESTITNLTKGPSRPSEMRDDGPPLVPSRPPIPPPMLEVLPDLVDDDIEDLLGPKPEPNIADDDEDMTGDDGYSDEAEQVAAIAREAFPDADVKIISDGFDPEPIPEALVPDPVERVIRDTPPESAPTSRPLNPTLAGLLRR
jgi:hypothetical protein